MPQRRKQGGHWVAVAALKEGKEARIVVHAEHSQNMWSGVSSGVVWEVAGGGEAGTVASVCCPDRSREDRANCSAEVGAAEVVETDWRRLMRMTERGQPCRMPLVGRKAVAMPPPTLKQRSRVA